MAYTPGVARVSRAIHEDTDTSFNLTIRNLAPDYIVPSLFNRQVSCVATAVMKAAVKTGVARRVPKLANDGH